MSESKYFSYYLPILLFITMLVDAHISSGLMSLFAVPMTFTSNLTLLLFMFSTFKVGKVYLTSWAAVIGLLYDSYFYNVIGINLILYPLLVLLMYLLFEHVIPNTFTLILSFIVFVTLLSIGRVLLLTAFNLTNTTFLDFFTRNLTPTLLINTLYITLFVIPLSKLFGLKKKKKAR
ncbi:rod shape-determining protein MreD [Vagococcus jeotgali]|uniref:rod shape-determining protein MreD n=1 Tax=Vagococcus jeotgali TaxID=3109030 RepID=UPI002DDBCD8E|nr:rod shape-determining protein MreD [Vagococcus sp. B2T-5]